MKSVNSKCGEIFRNEQTGNYVFICFHCAKEFDSPNEIVDHIDTHFQTTKTTNGLPAKTNLENVNNHVEETNDSSFKRDFESSLEATVVLKRLSLPEVKEEMVYESDNNSDGETSTDNPSTTSNDDMPGSTRVGSGMFKCDTCGTIISGKSRTREHLDTHANLRLHKCDVCGKCFNIKYALTKHYRLHSQGDEADDGESSKEPEETNNVEDVDEEMEEEEEDDDDEEEEEIIETQCDVCGFESEERDVMVSHLRTHEQYPEKEFVCQLCGMEYAKKILLTNHMRNHKGWKYFQLQYQ